MNLVGKIHSNIYFPEFDYTDLDFGVRSNYKKCQEIALEFQILKNYLKPEYFQYIFQKQYTI